MSTEKENLNSGEPTPEENFISETGLPPEPTPKEDFSKQPSFTPPISEESKEYLDAAYSAAFKGAFMDAVPEDTELTLEQKAKIFALTTTEGPKADDYHTTGELYGCRHALMIALCNSHPTSSFKTKNHSDGTPMFEGYFLLGFRKNKGNQISFHLPVTLWDFAKVPELPQAPEFDGHNTQDVIARLLMIGN